MHTFSRKSTATQILLLKVLAAEWFEWPNRKPFNNAVWNTVNLKICETHKKYTGCQIKVTKWHPVTKCWRYQHSNWPFNCPQMSHDYHMSHHRLAIGKHIPVKTWANFTLTVTSLKAHRMRSLNITVSSLWTHLVISR